MANAQTPKPRSQINMKSFPNATGFKGARARLKHRYFNAKSIALKRLRESNSYRLSHETMKQDLENAMKEKYEKEFTRKIAKAIRVWRSFTAEEREAKREKKWELELEDYWTESEGENTDNKEENINDRRGETMNKEEIVEENRDQGIPEFLHWFYDPTKFI
jgi:hypothetical protein